MRDDANDRGGDPERDDIGDDDAARGPATARTMLPELLPAPGAPARGPDGARPGPRERVAARARTFLDQLRGVGTTAAAAVFGLQCSGYGVVDPLPPPPAQCASLLDPFAPLGASATLVATDGGGPPEISMELYTATYPAYVGYRIDAARVSGGTLIRIEDQTASVRERTQFVLTIGADSLDTTVAVELDLGCGGAARTKKYQLLIGPAPSQLVTVIEEIDNGDGGAGERRD